MKDLERTSDLIQDDEAKRPFSEPKLSFVTPELVKQGSVNEMTGFFVTFSP